MLAKAEEDREFEDEDDRERRDGRDSGSQNRL
jgi:hypothetical protein